MPTAILPATVAIPRLADRSMSSTRFLSGTEQSSFCSFPVKPASPFSSLIIRMGGGPRTYPGGVSKWQWKRMQAKKAKQLLKARLCRERQLYEMRKRAELKAAISELERPWEVVERAPQLFSVSADEQVKALADRFQRAGGFDMWNEKDGPQIFQAPDGLPSARLFPKGVVHSVKPYGIVSGSKESLGEDGSKGGEELRFDDWVARGGGGVSRRRSRRSSNRKGGAGTETIDVEARELDGGSSQVAENMHPSSGNSTFARKFGREDSSAVADQRVLKENVLKGSLEDKDANIEPDGILIRHSNRRQHGIEATDKGESGKMMGIGRNTSSNRRFKGGRISLRPTTDLYSEDDSYRMRDSKYQR
ncbi:probable DEAD-box ATP-dependent RNA helicase 48 [Phoenix dactylifera]|uniref:Probable DEAD-box ATP-dependent RNA helicase 48 n=1 Tax=Phoenix dactylifera TaxID=42345 RepID=A0A8B9B1D0_PHODC|nr:probable DEAD-box ATP-dependent RNA helicase 48 [Phoenix dactylifera]XP_038989544.1 probable DEAD-box ATP-dependent RNA helicase 48 [Phoenix dactylifera]